MGSSKAYKGTQVYVNCVARAPVGEGYDGISRRYTIWIITITAARFTTSLWLSRSKKLFWPYRTVAVTGPHVEVERAPRSSLFYLWHWQLASVNQQYYR